MTSSGSSAATSTTKSDSSLAIASSRIVVGELADVGLELADHPRREAAVHELAVPGVVGRIHHQHEPAAGLLGLGLHRWPAPRGRPRRRAPGPTRRCAASRLHAMTSACLVMTQKPGPSGSGWWYTGALARSHVNHSCGMPCVNRSGRAGRCQPVCSHGRPRSALAHGFVSRAPTSRRTARRRRTRGRARCGRRRPGARRPDRGPGARPRRSAASRTRRSGSTTARRPTRSPGRAPSISVSPSSVIFQPSPSGAKPRFSIHIGSYQLNGT